MVVFTSSRKFHTDECIHCRIHYQEVTSVKWRADETGKVLFEVLSGQVVVTESLSAGLSLVPS